MKSIQYEIYAKIAKALANPIRLKIIYLLYSKNEICVCEFVKLLKLAQPVVSKHLTTLKQAGIVKMRKNKQTIYYSLTVPCIINFFNCANKVIKYNKRYYLLA